MTIPQGLIPSPFQSRLPAELTAEDFIDVCGQAVPVCLSGTDAEYDAFRNSAGIIDFSMLFKWEISGSGAVATANKVVSRDVSKLRPGQVAYGVVVDDDGLMMDDCTIFRYEDGRVMIIGGNLDVGNVISAHLEADTEVNQIRSQVGVLSLQGPKSRAILQTLTGTDLRNEAFPYYTFKVGVQVAGLDAQINRLGFTAELGYEIMVDANSAPQLWDAVRKAGEPYGLLPCVLDVYRQNAEIRANIINEILRFDTPEQFVARRTTVPITIGESTIEAGEDLFLMVGAANKDPEIFEDPHTFDIYRENMGRHLAFGGGMHGCVGQIMARATANIVFSYVANNYPDITVNGDVVEGHTEFMRTFHSVPLKLR